jgi:hypothetical protein
VDRVDADAIACRRALHRIDLVKSRTAPLLAL